MQCTGKFKGYIRIRGTAWKCGNRILKTAFSAGMISNEKLWLDALASRNNVAHAYNHDVAIDIIHDVKEKYYEMFVALKEEIQEKWL